MKRSGWLALAFGLMSVTILAFWRRPIDGSAVHIHRPPRHVADSWIVFRRGDVLTDRISDQVGWEYGRDQTWPAYLRVAAMRPLAGYGPGYPQGSYAVGLPGPVDYALGPENTTLHIALTGGGIGLLACLWLVGAAVCRVWRRTPAGGQHFRNRDCEVASPPLRPSEACSVIATGNLQEGCGLFVLSPVPSDIRCDMVRSIEQGGTCLADAPSSKRAPLACSANQPRSQWACFCREDWPSA